jgi:hypothetical protein
MFQRHTQLPDIYQYAVQATQEMDIPALLCAVVDVVMEGA